MRAVGVESADLSLDAWSDGLVVVRENGRVGIGVRAFTGPNLGGAGLGVSLGGPMALRENEATPAEGPLAGVACRVGCRVGCFRRGDSGRGRDGRDVRGFGGGLRARAAGPTD